MKRTQPSQRRYERALHIVAAGLVSPNGSDGAYFVRSQTDGTTRYTTHHRRATGGGLACDCPDVWAKSRGLPCKHIQAVEIYESAEGYAWQLCQRHGLTLGQLESRVLADLVRGVPDELTAARLSALLATVRRLQEERKEHTS